MQRVNIIRTIQVIYGMQAQFPYLQASIPNVWGAYTECRKVDHSLDKRD